MAGSQGLLQALMLIQVVPVIRPEVIEEVEVDPMDLWDINKSEFASRKKVADSHGEPLVFGVVSDCNLQSNDSLHLTTRAHTRTHTLVQRFYHTEPAPRKSAWLVTGRVSLASHACNACSPRRLVATKTPWTR